MKKRTYEPKDIRCYYFNKGPLWIGWIVVKWQEPQPILYSDNEPTTLIEPEMNMEYVTFGLSKNHVMPKLFKRANEIVKKASDYEKGE